MNKECKDCDSTSMEMCLRRRCPYWVERPKENSEKEKHIKDSTELSGGHLW